MDAGTIVLLIGLVVLLILIGGFASGISRRRRGSMPGPPAGGIVDQPSVSHPDDDDIAGTDRAYDDAMEDRFADELTIRDQQARVESDSEEPENRPQGTGRETP